MLKPSPKPTSTWSHCSGGFIDSQVGEPEGEKKDRSLAWSAERCGRMGGRGPPLHTDFSHPQSSEREQRTQEGLLGARGWALDPEQGPKHKGTWVAGVDMNMINPDHVK